MPSQLLPQLTSEILTLPDEQVESWHTNTVAKLLLDCYFSAVPKPLQSLYKYCLERIEPDHFEIRFIGKPYNYSAFQSIRELNRQGDECARTSSNPGTNPLNHAVYSCQLGSLCLQERRDRRYEISFHTSTSRVWNLRQEALTLQGVNMNHSQSQTQQPQTKEEMYQWLEAEGYSYETTNTHMSGAFLEEVWNRTASDVPVESHSFYYEFGSKFLCSPDDYC